MELTGTTLRRSLPSVLPAVAGGRRWQPSRVACARGSFADEGHLRFYEAGSSRKVVGPRDLARVRAVGLAARDATKEEEATDLLSEQLNQMEVYAMKQARKEEKAAMKALKKQKKAAAMMMSCEDGSSSESSESDCEDEPVMKIEQGMGMVSTPVSELGAASGVSTDKAAMKAMKKMEKEQKKAAKKAMKKMKKEAKKMVVATVNDCRDEDSSSCSSESSESECEGEVFRMSRCATIVAPQQPAPSTVFPIVVPQLPEAVQPEPSQDPRVSLESPAPAMQCATSVTVVEKPMASRIEVCMGGKCKKAGAATLLQEFEKVVGTGGAAVGCKCLGKCGLGPNVRLRSEGCSAEDGSVKKNPLCIGVGLEDVATIVTGLFGDGDLGMTPA